VDGPPTSVAAVRAHRPPTTKPHTQQFGHDCRGVLTLGDTSLEFNLYSDRNLSQSFMFYKREIRSINKNGVKLLTGKKYHFDVPGMTKQQITQLFAEWYEQ
jgi:hypothetical protein